MYISDHNKTLFKNIEGVVCTKEASVFFMTYSEKGIRPSLKISLFAVGLPILKSIEGRLFFLFF